MSASTGIPDLTTTTDKELILKSQQGDMDAFETLVQRYDKRVLTIAAGYVDNSEDAKDIYQEVFYRVYRGLPKFELRSEFSTWLFRITTNVCLSHRVRARKHAHASIDGGPDDDELPHTQPDGLKDHQTAQRLGEDMEINARIESALAMLSPRQRMIFSLRHYEGQKLTDIARTLDLSEGSVKKYLFEATTKMRVALKDLVR